MKKTLLIELYAGPGAGKTTCATYVFSRLKLKQKLKAEILLEEHKPYTYNSGFDDVDWHEMFNISVKKHLAVYNSGKLDVIITDAPLPLFGLYRDEKIPDYGPSIQVMKVWVNRVKKYDPTGRWQTEEEAKALDKEFRHKVNADIYVDGSEKGYNQLINIIERR